MSDTKFRPIFVFGSNLAGRHGKGAALHAREHYGAEYGVGAGPTGHAYAIPTKDARLRTLPLEEIEKYVRHFLEYAAHNWVLQFKVTAIGTGLAGYTHEQIAPMFRDAPSNCHLPEEWAGLLGSNRISFAVGETLADNTGMRWVFVGWARTTAGVTAMFVRDMTYVPHQPGSLWTYTASNDETLAEKFPSKRWSLT